MNQPSPPPTVVTYTFNGSLRPGAGIGRATVPSGRRLVTAGFSVAVVVVLLAAGYVTLFGAPSFGGPTGAPNPSPGSGPLAPGKTQPGCQQPNMATSLLIPNSNPATSITAGDHVGVTFEFNVTVTNVPVAGLRVYTPTVFVTMPLIGGSGFPVTFNNHTFTMTGLRWTSLSYSKLVTSDFAFNPTANATLSTQKVGTMADTPYGTLTLQWRWSWNVTFPSGGYLQGPWSVPTSSMGNSWQPSIFEPAPYVDLVSESPANDLIGSNYTMYLAGDVAARSFFFELETPTGTVWASEWVYDNSTTNATFETNFTLLGRQNYLNPGLYIVHIHDSCIALLYSKRVTLAYAPTASVRFVTTPSNCGTITFDGVTYNNGQSATVVPSPNPYNYSWRTCKGFIVSHLTLEGAIHFVSPGLLVISANGSFILNFRQTAPLIAVAPGQGPVGATVTVSGTGFSVSTTLASLVFDSVSITSCTNGSLMTGGTGSFSCTFAVPNNTSGTAVVATDVGGQMATGTFLVVPGGDPVEFMTAQWEIGELVQ